MKFENNNITFSYLVATLKMGAFDIGVMTWEGKDALEAIEWVDSLGFKTMHLGSPPIEHFIDEKKEKLIKKLKETGIKISAIFVHWKGTNYVKKETIGLINPIYREERIKHVFMTSDFAKDLGVDKLAQHVGYIPENTSDLYHRIIYKGLVDAMQKITEFLDKNNQSWLCETGQETPETLVRFIEDVGAKNLKINFDPANLLYYGWMNGIEIDLIASLELLKDYIEGVHCKDGLFPEVEARERKPHMVKEVPFGKGQVGAKQFIQKLNEIGYNGPLIIEREMATTEQRINDIKWTHEFLEKMM